MKIAINKLIIHEIVIFLYQCLVTVSIKVLMARSSDKLHDVMSDIVDKVQQLVKDKIARIPMTVNQPTGQPMALTPVVQPMVQLVPSDGKPMTKQTSMVVQQYADSDSREYLSSKEGRQARLDAREKLRQDMQMEARK